MNKAVAVRTVNNQASHDVFVDDLHLSITQRANSMTNKCFTYVKKNKGPIQDIVFAVFYFLISSFCMQFYATKFLKQSNKNTVLSFEQDVVKYWTPLAKFVDDNEIVDIAPTVITFFSTWMTLAKGCSTLYRGKKLTSQTHVIIVFMAALISAFFQIKILRSNEGWVGAIETVMRECGKKVNIENAGWLSNLFRNIDTSQIAGHVHTATLLAMNPIDPSWYMQSSDTITATLIRTNIYKPALNILFHLIYSGHMAITARGAIAVSELFIPKDLRENRHWLTANQTGIHWNKNCTTLDRQKILVAEWEQIIKKENEKNRGEQRLGLNINNKNYTNKIHKPIIHLKGLN